MNANGIYTHVVQSKESQEVHVLWRTVHRGHSADIAAMLVDQSDVWIAVSLEASRVPRVLVKSPENNEDSGWKHSPMKVAVASTFAPTLLCSAHIFTGRASPSLHSLPSNVYPHSHPSVWLRLIWTNLWAALISPGSCSDPSQVPGDAVSILPTPRDRG